MVGAGFFVTGLVGLVGLGLGAGFFCADLALITLGFFTVFGVGTLLLAGVVFTSGLTGVLRAVFFLALAAGGLFCTGFVLTLVFLGLMVTSSLAFGLALNFLDLILGVEGSRENCGAGELLPRSIGAGIGSTGAVRDAAALLKAANV